VTSFIGNMGLSNKFRAAFGMVCILCLLQGTAALVGLSRIGSLTDGLTQHSQSAAQAAQMSADSTRQIGNEGEQINGANRSFRWLVAGIMGVVTILGICVGVFLTHLVVPPILAATTALERVAEKDLTVSVETVREDEIGRLSGALNASVAAMRAVVQSVAQGAGTLSAAAEELSARSNETSGNTQLQSSKTGQIASAAQEMTSVIGEISENVEAAAVLSRESADLADQGGVVLQAASAAMEKIATGTGLVAEKMDSLAHRSEEIGKVITMIQEISEQTNLLALNAAIEAARAGEHGRGFAVVAGEVRRLAERTKCATQDIAQTIKSIQDETKATLELTQGNRKAVEAGLNENERARSSLTAIADTSKQVEQMIFMIATAASEETTASKEIAESASQISELSTNNSRAAEEAAGACKSLSTLTNDLDGIIRTFRTNMDFGQKSFPIPC